MPEFKGLKRDELEKLRRAVTTHERITGEKVDIGAIPEYNDEDAAKEAQERAQRELEQQAATARQLENAQQAARRIARGNQPSDVQDENPGPDMPAMVSERAKAQGVSRKGEEPETVTGKPPAAPATPAKA